MRLVEPNASPLETAGPQETEPELVARAIAGNREAFTTLYDRYSDRIYRHVLYRVSSVEDAEDLTQLVFLNAWRAIGRYRITGSPFAAWLFTIAHNAVMTYYRRGRPTVPLEGDAFEEERDDVDPEQAAESALNQERVRSAISQLRPDRQQVVSMRFLDDLPHKDIADTMGKSEGAVRVIQHRALLELRRMLREDEQQDTLAA